RECTGVLRLPLGEAREDRKHTVAVFRAVGAGAAVAAEIEIFADAHIGEDAAAFGHVDQTFRYDRGGSRALNRRTRESDGAAPRAQHARDRAVERGFPRAV